MNRHRAGEAGPIWVLRQRDSGGTARRRSSGRYRPFCFFARKIGTCMKSRCGPGAGQRVGSPGAEYALGV